MTNDLPGADQYPLSFNQDFMVMFDQGDSAGPFGPRYHLTHGLRVRGRVDVDAMRGALDDVVARNEVLRTEVVRGEDRYARIHPPSPTELVVQDLTGTDPADRDRRAEELLIEIEATEYDIQDARLIRAVLAEFADDDWVLVLIVHHSATDSWSMQLITKEIAEFYTARREQRAPNLPEARQYREFAAWERANTTEESLARSAAYWRKKLEGAQMPMMATDFPRSAGLPRNTSVERYLADSDLTTATQELARATRSSPFMVLLAAYNVLLRELSGRDDITVLTITSGRGQAQFEEMIGPFYNLVPLRTDLAGAESFREIIGRTRKTCLEAFSHPIPFAKVMAEAPHIADPWVGDTTAGIAFQVFQFPFVMADQRVSDLTCSEIRRRLLPAEVSTDIPDGALWTLDIDPARGEMIGQVQYNSDRYHASTIRDLLAQFLQVIKDSLSTTD
jgi:condensation enzyme